MFCNECMNVQCCFYFICCLDIAVSKWLNFDKSLQNFEQKMLMSVKILMAKHCIKVILETRYKSTLPAIFQFSSTFGTIFNVGG